MASCTSLPYCVRLTLVVPRDTFSTTVRTSNTQYYCRGYFLEIQRIYAASLHRSGRLQQRIDPDKISSIRGLLHKYVEINNVEFPWMTNSTASGCVSIAHYSTVIIAQPATMALPGARDSVVFATVCCTQFRS